jgi:hypothetical protein
VDSPARSRALSHDTRSECSEACSEGGRGEPSSEAEQSGAGNDARADLPSQQDRSRDPKGVWPSGRAAGRHLVGARVRSMVPQFDGLGASDHIAHHS